MNTRKKNGYAAGSNPRLAEAKEKKKHEQE
jgi:hypothetical protein